MDTSFWIIGGTTVAGFAALWITFFVSVRKDEGEQEDPDDHLDNLSAPLSRRLRNLKRRMFKNLSVEAVHLLLAQIHCR